MIKLLRIWRALWAIKGFWGYPPILWTIWIICIALLFVIASQADELKMFVR